MKLRDLKQRIDLMLERQPNTGEYDVVIVRRDPSVGAKATTALQSLHAGFDWEAGKVLLYPAVPLHHQTQPEAIHELRKQLDGMVWENRNLKDQLKKLGHKPCTET